MSELFLQIAVSLDGYIEDPNGDIDWMVFDATVDPYATQTLESIDGMIPRPEGPRPARDLLARRSRDRGRDGPAPGADQADERRGAALELSAQLAGGLHPHAGHRHARVPLLEGDDEIVQRFLGYPVRGEERRHPGDEQSQEQLGFAARDAGLATVGDAEQDRVGGGHEGVDLGHASYSGAR